jgi:hypothetical protein
MGWITNFSGLRPGKFVDYGTKGLRDTGGKALGKRREARGKSSLMLQTKRPKDQETKRRRKTGGERQ